MTTASATSKQLVEEYFHALSGKPKTEQVIDQYVDDPHLRKHILDTEASFPGYELIVHHLVSEDDIVAVNCTFKATHKGTFMGIEPTGKTISLGAMIFYRVSNGRIAQFWMQVDMMDGLNQLKS